MSQALFPSFSEQMHHSQTHWLPHPRHTSTVSIPLLSASVALVHFSLSASSVFPCLTHAESCSLLSVAPCPCCTPALGTSACCPGTQGRLGYTTSSSLRRGWEGGGFSRISCFKLFLFLNISSVNGFNSCSGLNTCMCFRAGQG